jgi:hypothetical protein
MPSSVPQGPVGAGEAPTGLDSSFPPGTRLSASDFRLIERAFRRGWVPQEKREALIDRVEELALNPETSARIFIAACGFLLEQGRLAPSPAPASDSDP